MENESLARPDRHAIEGALLRLVGERGPGKTVDPTEAATRVADLTDHINTSLALTARLQQLSLLKYLT